MGLTYVGLAVLMRFAHAGDTTLVLSETRLAPAEDSGATFFGYASGVGDFDGDGYNDQAISAQNEVWVYYGSSHGSTTLTPQLIEAGQGSEDRRVGNFGYALASADLNADGIDELLVSAPAYDGGVYIYAGGPAGVSASSESLLVEFVSDPFEEGFGTGLAALGDMDGDGAVEVGIGAPEWTGDAGPGEQYPGALFVYSTGGGGLDACSELQIRPLSTAKELGFLDFGFGVAALGDTNGDGYEDMGVTCARCSPPECYGCGQVIVWPGGAALSFHQSQAHVLYLNDPAWEEAYWNYWGWTVDAAGDVNADGFGDVIVGGEGGPTLAFGGAAGLEEASMQNLSDVDGLWVSGIGDFDADGYDDVAASGGEWQGDFGGPGAVHILFGDIDGISADRQMQLTATPEQDGFGNSVIGVGDVTGDGRPDLAVGADYEGGGTGAMYVYSSICTWYRDSDGDGYGNPDDALTDCHEQPGYGPRPDDCDDTDASVHGAFWYSDADGDGYGRHNAGSLACVRPASVAAEPFDCDDSDPARHPDAADDTLDGIDQDCDDHDGAWDYHTGDCSEDTGDSGDTRDTGDTGDSGDPDESGGSADTSDPEAISDTGGETPAGEHDCGCSAAPGVGVGAWMGGGLVVLTAVLRRSRRSRTAGECAAGADRSGAAR